MSEIKEKKLKDYPEMVSLKSAEIIIDQMKKNICNIILDDGSKGTGFFCKIPFINNEELKVLITNNHVISLDIEKITISINNESEIKEIDLNNRIKYTNKDYDITIIEIKEEDNINNYLKLDKKIMKEGINKTYNKNSIYIIQYPENNKLGVSYGIIVSLDEKKTYDFKHSCNTENGSSGSPIINLSNNMVIGIHKEASSQGNYNKGLFLNYAIEDFIKKKLIKELNERFKLNLKENDNLDILNLSRRKISNIEILDKIVIDNLKELDLSRNKIPDIKVLEKVKFENLEKLNLSWNHISDIEVLEKVKFENLKSLNLDNNKISDIKVLEKVKFEKLENIDLSNNKIPNIEALEKVKFENIKDLNLSGNKIFDIKVLEKVKFENLKVLNLSSNQISNIEILDKIKIENLEELDLSCNKILDIKVLEKIALRHLKILNLSWNHISDIKVLEKAKFENLEKLNLYYNKISEIEGLFIQNKTP